MDRKITALLGVAVAVMTASAAYAATPPVQTPAPAFYHGVLAQNPLPALQRDDARLANGPAGEMKVAQFHHRHRRRYNPHRYR